MIMSNRNGRLPVLRNRFYIAHFRKEDEYERPGTPGVSGKGGDKVR